MDELVSFILDLIKLLLKVPQVLFNSFVDGINFFVSTFTELPLFLLDLFEELPKFYQIGLSGIFGLLILVLFLKLVSLVNLNG